LEHCADPEDAIIRTPHQLEMVAGSAWSRWAPFYGDSTQGRRCLVSAGGFYEWRIEGKGKTAKKQPFLIQRQDGRPFAFARMWDKVQVKGR
jgi:putative SOS response-associated peptidase YedK